MRREGFSGGMVLANPLRLDTKPLPDSLQEAESRLSRDTRCAGPGRAGAGLGRAGAGLGRAGLGRAFAVYEASN